MSLSGLSNTQFPLTLDGTTSLDVSSLTIDGVPIDITNLVPYTGATQTLDMGSQNIKTTHTPVLGPDVINLTTLTNAVLYVDTANALTYLNKVTTTEQNVAAATTFNSTVTANYFYTDNSYNWGRPSSSYNAWAIGRILNSGVIRDLQFRDDTAGVTTLLLSSTGQTVYVGLTCNYATGSKIPIFDSDRKLVSSGVDSIKITYLDNVSSDLQSQLNARAVLAGGNSFSGSQNYSDVTASTVAIFDGSKNLVSSVISVTELNYLGGLTSGVQGQINGKLSLTGGTMTGDIGLGANKITSSATPVTDDTLTRKGYVDSAITGAGLLYVLKTGSTITGDLTLSNLTASRVLILDASKAIKTSSVTTTELDNLTGITANIQSQFNAIISALSGYLSIYGGTLQGTLYNSVGDFHPYKGGDTNRACVLFANNADGATYASYNGGLASWFGIGFKCRLDSITRFIFNTRDGNSSQTGTLTCGGLTSSGNLTVADGYTTNISNGLIVSETNLGFSVSNLTGYSIGGVTAGSVSYNSSLQWWVINANSASGAVQVSGFTPVAGTKYQFTMSALGGGQSGQTIQWYQGTLSSPISSLYSVPFGSTTNFVGYFTPSNIVGTVFLLIQSPTSSNTYIYLDVGAGQTGFTLKRTDTNIPGLLTCGGVSAGSLYSSGNVGIGVPTSGTFRAPLAKLTVNSNYNSGDTGGFCINAYDGTEYNLRLYPYVQAGGQVAYQFRTYNQAVAYNSMVIGHNGSVGIGTVNPLCSLYNYGAGTSGWKGMSYFGNENTGVVAGCYDNKAYLGGHSSALNAWTDVYLAPSGNVSIGLATPTYRLTVTGDISASGSLLFGEGTYTAGCIFSNSAWGCITRAKTAGATARFLWTDVNDIHQMRISPSGVLNFYGGATPYAVLNSLNTTAGALVIGAIDRNYASGWNAGLLMECQDTTGITLHDSGNRLASFMYYDTDKRFHMGKDAGGWGVTAFTFESDLTCNANITAEQFYANGWFRINNNNNGLYWQNLGRGIQSPEGGGNTYGTITTYGVPRNTWCGYGLDSKYCFMKSQNTDEWGIHDNSYSWIIYGSGQSTRDVTIGGGVARFSREYDRCLIYANATDVFGGYFYYNQNNAYGTISDRRIKRDFLSITEEQSVTFIKALEPTSFCLKDSTCKTKLAGGEEVEEVGGGVCSCRQDGWVAQNVLEACHKSGASKSVINHWYDYEQELEKPEEERTTLIGVSDRPILSHTVNVVKTLLDKVDVLTQRNKVLEAWARDSETKQKKMEADIAKMASLLAQMMAK